MKKTKVVFAIGTMLLLLIGTLPSLSAYSINIEIQFEGYCPSPLFIF